MKHTFFARRALPILMVVFFAAPFALRGARLAVQSLRNDVKDWLPSSFDETTQLEWFRDHFLGEQFIVASWAGCTGEKGDERFRVFVDRFFPEVPPSKQPEAPEVDESEYYNNELGLYVRQLRAPHGKDAEGDSSSIGERYGLYTVDGHDENGELRREYYTNWGLKREKWLRGTGDRWYYLEPDGQLYLWHGGSTPVAAMLRQLRRLIFGPKEVTGEWVARLDAADAAWYYHDPRRLEAPLFKTVLTGPSLLHELTTQSLEGDLLEAKRRLKGLMFGPNGKQTCLLITLTDAGKEDMRRVVGRGLLGKPRGKLLNLAEEAGLYVPPKPSLLPPPLDRLFAKPSASSRPEIRFGGPAVDNVAIDEEGQVTLVRLVGLSVILGIALSWISFRSFYVTVMIFIVGGLSAVVSLAIVWWTGHRPDAVLMSMPSLVYVLGLSGAVHIVNYYRDAVETHGLDGASGRALRLGWQPCTLAAVTTGLGLMSLTFSNIVPIQKFGMFSAIGVVATLVLLFTYLPAALELWPPGYRKKKDGGGVEAPTTMVQDAVSRFWSAMGRFIIGHHGLVTICTLLVMGVFAVGLTRINTSIQLLKLFHREAKIIKDYTWLEAHLGNLVPMELVVRVDPAMMRFDLPENQSRLPEAGREDKFALNFLRRMEITTQIQEVIDRQFGPQGEGKVGQAMLAATFAPELPGTKERGRGIWSRQLERNRSQLLASDYLRLERGTGAELWRISLRLQALSDVDYGQFVNELKGVVEPVMSAYKYRERILRELDKLPVPDQEDASPRHVYCLGVPSPDASSPAGAQPDDAAMAASAGTGVAADKQTAIFWQVLKNLLWNDRIGNQLIIVQDHGLGGPLPNDWPNTLASQDCVVLLRDDPHYDLDLIRDRAPRFIDARDHLVGVTATATADEQPAPISTVYTGVVPVVYKAQRTLLESLFRSTGWAFVMIAAVMMVVVRSPSAGLISMLPNVFPVLVVFGAMCWMDKVVDIGSMMCASVAMGVAVDDTIHFWTWFRRGLDQGLDRRSSIMLSYNRCATAMTQTTLIGGLGLSIFAFSTFTPTQRFGVLMLVLMLTALVGDLVFLPAILAGPLGKAFERRTKKKPAPAVPLERSEAEMPSPHRIERPHGAPTPDGKARVLRADDAHRQVRR